MENQQKPKSNKRNQISPWWFVLIAVLFAALAVTVVLLIVDGSNDAKQTENESISEEIDASSGETTDPGAAVAGYGSNTPTALSTYAVTEAAPNDVDMSAVVAINDAGEACLNNGELQIYYWIEFYGFMNSYGSYAAMLGLDTATPLDQQQSMQEGSTWEQYFLESAALHYSENYALAQAAYANGYTISEEDEANIADMADPNGTFAAEAKEYDYDSAEAYIQANFGKGVGVADYQKYLRTYYAAYDYYTSQQEALEGSLTEEEVEAYYDENAATFEESGLKKVNNIQVRHILIGVEGEQDENGEYPEEAWTAAEEAANSIYADWQTNPTEEYFAELANAKSTDSGSNTAGGLYDDVYPGQMVSEFNDWCFDESRAYGDHGIVKTPYGYHIMFFVGQSENRQWYTAALEDMVSVQMNAMLDEVIAKYPLKFDYTKVRIYDMISTSIVAE